MTRSSVAELAGSDPTEIERPHDCIDPDGLEALFAPTGDATDRAAGQVSFRLDADTVTVHATGDIIVAREG
ncbi:HalOD1 output domain-containing protein [Natrinema saccharevitans]|nr:HalOD1 output domain-containing protein [Natrinema saccharevitans]